jgi:hypothetical protein
VLLELGHRRLKERQPSTSIGQTAMIERRHAWFQRMGCRAWMQPPSSSSAPTSP